jgi:hypothetical protein
MLTITTDDTEYYDDAKSEFIRIKGRTVELEHSLVSLSKWESKWCKPFLGKEPKTDDQLQDYIRCMTITKNVPDEFYSSFSKEIVDEISGYIDAKMTATTFSEIHNSSRSSEIVTAELIYYWMIALNIPFECQKWHLNRLLTLIRVCSIKNAPSKKMPKSAVLSRNAALNAARKQQLNTKG